MVLIFGAMMTSFVRAYADHRGIVKDPAELKRMGGLLERMERLMLLYAGMFLGLFNTEWMMAVIAITAVLANATAAAEDSIRNEKRKMMLNDAGH